MKNAGKHPGLMSISHMRSLKIGFVALIAIELIVSLYIFFKSDAIYSHLANLVTLASVPGAREAALAASQTATSSIMTLLGLIILGSVLGSALFWTLARYIRLSALLTDFVSDGVAITGEHWRVKAANHAFAQILGEDLEKLPGRRLDSVLPGCKSITDIPKQTSWTCEYEGSQQARGTLIASVSVFVLDRRRGKPVRSLVTIKDITNVRVTENNIHQLAYFDDLTGLPNRVHLQKKLTEAIETEHADPAHLALLYMDLDGFKDVNDSLGHDAGDELLQQMAVRFQRGVRTSDFVARLGGDEFCVVLDRVRSSEQVAAIADRLLREIEQPLMLRERRLKPHASIGIAMFPGDGKTREALMQAADTAMYAAKRDGKHRYAYFQPELRHLVDTRLALEHDLRLAVEEKQFFLLYQPQISLKTGKMIGVEALIRWRHPQRGLVPPDEFIPVAERLGIISDIGDWVLEKACWQLKEWQESNIELKIAVNISGSHFQDQGLYDTVENLLEETGIDPNRLELEITEGVMQIEAGVVENFHELKELGVRLAIDDFGTGYSGLSSLKKLPLDHLKIDRAFLQDVFEDKKQSVILGTIVGMGHALGLQVIVEGVETREQLLFLKGIGCQTVQGFYFSAAVSAEKVVGFWRDGIKPATEGQPTETVPE